MHHSVLFIDPPAFCTTVEGLAAPALRSRPLVVAAPGAARATVLALSPEARTAGIERGMAVARARKLCPDLVLLPPNPRLYAQASRALHDVLQRYAPVIEPKGYGHAFLDLTGTGRLFGPPVDVAMRIRREAHDRVGLSLAVGAAANKLVSQVAAALIKPGTDTLAVPLGGEPDFLAPRPVGVLPDLDPRMRERLTDYQLDLIGEVAAIDPRQLAAVFGPRGVQLHALARGIDPRPVLPPALKAEFRAGHTLGTDTNDLGVLHSLLRRLSERIGLRLRQRRLVAGRLTVQIGYTDFATTRRNVPLTRAMLDVELWDAARRAFTLANQRTLAIRAVALTADRLFDADLQLELWEMEGAENEKREPGRAAALQHAVDRIRTRYGTGSLRGRA
jgi:DNA polymerase-4